MFTKENRKRESSSGNELSFNAKKQKGSGNAEELTSSALKRAVRKQRQATRRHAESVAEAKDLWNKLRLKTNTKDGTKIIMDKLMELIRGKIRDIALQHDASRVVQAAIQFGSDKQRKEVLAEICRVEGSLAEMAKIQYAHFCCLKLIKYCARDDASIRMVVKSFKGEMPRLAVHGVGARVVEYLFLNLSPKQTASLKQEFYGPHFSLFTQNLTKVPTLKSNIANAKTEIQKESAIDFVRVIIHKGMTKSFYGFTFFQQLLAEYVDVTEASEIRMISSMIAEHSIHLLSTRVGTRVVAACASYGTPKDRKRICKSLKGYTSSSLLHRDAYLALLRLVQVTDDTKSIRKSVLDEILAKAEENDDSENDAPNGILELALSETGSKLFLMLLVKDEKSRMKYFDPFERSILDPVPTIRENGKEIPTSKKDPDIRRKELLTHIKGGLSQTCIDNAEELLKSLPGSRVIKEVYAHAPSEKLANSIVDVCDKSIEIFEDPVAHRSIKNLILCDTESDKPFLAKLLVERLEKRFFEILKSNRGAFVAGALLKVPSVNGAVKETVRSKKKEIESKSKEKGSTAGYAALLKEISN